MIGRADIEGSKSGVDMNSWPPQASYPCGTVNPMLITQQTVKYPHIKKASQIPQKDSGQKFLREPRFKNPEDFWDSHPHPGSSRYHSSLSLSLYGQTLKKWR